MRVLMSFFLLFIFFVFPLKAEEEVPPPDASLRECFAEKDPSNNWRVYYWERTDDKGFSHIYFLTEGSKLTFEYVVDGLEHDFPHSKNWGSGISDKKYVVMEHSEEITHISITRLKEGFPSKVEFHFSLADKKTGLIHFKVTQETTYPNGTVKSSGMVICHPVPRG